MNVVGKIKDYRSIPFSPPDITDAEINEVVDALKSGWITTGPKTKECAAQRDVKGSLSELQYCLC